MHNIIVKIRRDHVTPGSNGVTENTMVYRPDLSPTMIPNPYRHPAYHILPNTLLVYQFIYIKHQEH